MTVPVTTPSPPAAETDVWLDASPATCTAAEIERWTGLAPERLRTWERRFGYPRMLRDGRGVRAFALDDVPGLLAAGQLVEQGLPVREAIDRVRNGLPEPDMAELRRTFDQLDAPVMVVGGPEPLRVVWANAAARQLECGGTELQLPASRTGTYRDLQLMLRSSTAALISHRWTDVQGRSKAVGWRLPAPTFVPPLVVLLQHELLDAHVVEDQVPAPVPNDRRERDEARWAKAIGNARRELQRGTPQTALAVSLVRLVEGIGAHDGVLLYGRNGELRGAASCRGRRVCARIPREPWAELDEACLQLRPVAVGASFAQELGLPGADLLAVPLIAGDREYGFAILEFGDGREADETGDELLMGWANAAAACHSSDLALYARRRAAAAVTEVGE